MSLTLIYLLLVNLLLLATLEEKFICGEFDHFLAVENNELIALEDKNFVDGAARDC